ncbi:MAG: nitroreductase [Deltaproteobacteria bacterium]|nr:nitroreductase [Deltaproteobacteria bacterium]
MELIEAMKTRKSVRAFRDDPVPKEKIEEILKCALLAPSAINLQPWEFFVVSGEEKQRLSRRLIKAYQEKRIPCGPGNVKPLPETLLKRGQDSFVALSTYVKQIGREFDEFINMGSCEFYGAPTAIIICLDLAFSQRRFIDIGIVLAYILLAVHDFGLGACPIGLIAAYEDEIKEVLNIPENKTVVIGVAVGYPDYESPVNAFKAQRDDLDKFVRWIE